MTTLVVQLPARDHAAPPGEWQLPALPFVYFDSGGRRLRSGVAAREQLPHASAQVLVLAPTDVLLLRATVPPLNALRVRQALPNLIEDQLVQDAARCHFALSPDVHADGTRTIAVVDRGWMRFVLEQFGAGDGRRLRVVPMLSCLPEARAGDGAVTLVEGPGDAAAASLQVVLQDDALPYGLALPRAGLAQSLAGLEHGRTLERRYVEPLAGTIATARDATYAEVLEDAESLDFEAVALRALDATPDLCQFEFAARRLQGARAMARRWRGPLALAAACGIVCIIGLNVQWLMLSRDRDRLANHAEQLLRDAFPKTTVILDAPLQMARNLESLRAAAGEIGPGDFLFMTGRLGEATGELPAGSVAALDYADRALTVTFRPGFVPPAGTSESLRRAGYTVHADGQKWQITGASK